MVTTVAALTPTFDQRRLMKSGKKRVPKSFVYSSIEGSNWSNVRFTYAFGIPLELLFNTQMVMSHASSIVAPVAITACAIATLLGWCKCISEFASKFRIVVPVESDNPDQFTCELVIVIEPVQSFVMTLPIPERLG